MNVLGQLFRVTLVDINFDAAASNGQTLSMSVTDTDQAGAQFAIRGIAYENQISAVPEPAVAGWAMAAMTIGFIRRRKS